MIAQHLQVMHFAVNMEILEHTFPMSMLLFIGGFLMLTNTMILHVLTKILWGQNTATKLHKTISIPIPVLYGASLVIITTSIISFVLPFVS